MKFYSSFADIVGFTNNLYYSIRHFWCKKESTFHYTHCVTSNVRRFRGPIILNVAPEGNNFYENHGTTASGNKSCIQFGRPFVLIEPLIPDSWSKRNALSLEQEVWSSNLGLVKLDTALPKAWCPSNISSKGAVLPAHRRGDGSRKLVTQFVVMQWV